MLEARGLCKSYGSRAVVSDLSLAVAAGEIVGLLGPNGAGKSTTVAMLCGLVAADRGEVFVGEGAARERADRAQPGAQAADRRRAAGALDLREPGHRRQPRALRRALRPLRRAAAERVAAALKLVGLADRAKDKPATFSGGMKRRLNIASALVHDPDILIFDEPTVGVDPQSRNAIFDNLEELRRRGKALLYTTHYMEEAERLCDRVVIVDHGKVVASDTLAGIEKLLPATQSLEIEVDGSPTWSRSRHCPASTR